MASDVRLKKTFTLFTQGVKQCQTNLKNETKQNKKYYSAYDAKLVTTVKVFIGGVMCCHYLN